MPKKSDKKLSPKERAALFDAWESELEKAFEALIDGGKNEIMTGVRRNLAAWQEGIVSEIADLIALRLDKLGVNIGDDLDLLKAPLLAKLDGVLVEKYANDEIEVWRDGAVQIRLRGAENAENG